MLCRLASFGPPYTRTLAHMHPRPPVHGYIPTSGSGMTWTRTLSLPGWAYVSDLFRIILPPPTLSTCCSFISTSDHASSCLASNLSVHTYKHSVRARTHTYIHTYTHNHSRAYSVALALLALLIPSCLVWASAGPGILIRRLIQRPLQTQILPSRPVTAYCP